MSVALTYMLAETQQADKILADVLCYFTFTQDPILFCLAADLGSKVVGEWPKDGWVKGWRQIDSSQVLDSSAGYK